MRHSSANDPAVRAAFEHEFHSRTLAYLPGFADDGRPVVVTIGEDAQTPTGHALTHCLINLLARAHRRIVVVGDLDRPLECASLFGYRTLRDATVGLAAAINPYIEVTRAAAVPTERLISLGVGTDLAELQLGADGWVAILGHDATLGDTDASMIGAALAACLGSHAAFARLTGTGDARAGRWSAWDYLTSSDGQGPALVGPLDVGRVLCAGAGAVASALAFFAAFFGIAGAWTVVDGDLVDVSNLNRQLAFLAADAGWSGRPSANKADLLSARLGPAARRSPEWYGVDARVVDAQYDVILALANEYGVREALAYRQSTVVLHATTSANWQAQVHRHVAGHDDCLPCRLPGDTPKMRCSEGEVPTPAGASMDAALPFLSATAGLMLLVELIRLARGRLLDTPHNYVAVEFNGPNVPAARRAIASCRPGCRTRLARHSRRSADAHSRWAYLDAT